MTYYFVSRASDGKFYICPARLSYADGVGDFHALERFGIVGKFDTRKEAEEYLDNTEVAMSGYKKGSLNFVFSKDK